MIISVVTVCKNAEKSIERTLQSLLTQNDCDFEYLIIDGKSSDDTLNLIRKYKPLMENRGICVHLISEKDSGIYNAMNKAVQLSRGSWINFLNAGDTFCNPMIIERVSDKLKDVPDAAVVYGDYYKTRIMQGKISNTLCRAREIQTILENMPFCHQAAFVRREALVRYRFNEDYQIAADYDLFLRMYVAQEKFLHMEEIIASFAMDGISQTQDQKLHKEYCSIYHSNGIWDCNKAINEIRYKWRDTKNALKKILHAGGQSLI